jgi:hypothetical protein
MLMLDPSLTDELVAIRAEIARVERAEPPVEAAIVARLSEAEAAARQFNATPFSVGGGDVRAASPAQVRTLVLGAMAALLPDATRELIETRTREAEQHRPVLRLTPEAKATQLTALRAKAQRIEAKLELLRRELEQDDPDTTFARAGFDPSVWLAEQGPLEAMAATGGKRR